MLVTQHTSFAVLGIEGRRFREMVARLRIKHLRDGKLIIVLVHEFVSAVDARSSPIALDLAPPDEADDIPSVDELLARLGRRRIR